MKIKLGVFMGGRSVEHEISIISAIQAIYAMNREKYEIVPVYIGKDGNMYTGDVLFEIENFKDEKLIKEKTVRVIPVKEGNEMILQKYPPSKLFGNNEVNRIQVAFPIVHGTNCEDGSLQGLFEVYDLPYVGCDVMSSAVGMDKVIMKKVLREERVPVVDYVSFSFRDWKNDREGMLREAESLGYPLIIKPANLGSSVGISKADDRDGLIASVDLAGQFALKIIVEKAVPHLREINCSVLGDYAKAEASLCEEPISGGEGILSYMDKYGGGNAKGGKGTGAGAVTGQKRVQAVQTGTEAGSGGGKAGTGGMSSASRELPANIPEEMTKEIRELAVRTFQVLGASGVARIDFLLNNETQEVFVNEINTIPGSLSFYLWEPSGKPYGKMLEELVELAFKRKRERDNLLFTYDENILAMGGSFHFGTKGGTKN